jgi:hypothetical protein
VSILCESAGRRSLPLLNLPPFGADRFLARGEILMLMRRSRSGAARQTHQAVIGRVLVCFASRGNGKSRVNELVDGAADMEYELPDMN